ncbi:hypothetical protein [Rhodovibrio salinarum]|uniref:hypothetical protein n=1 Tax=Rhodovibrio salinarum TaxID=1087 RepID=UPI0004867D3E|nr:hypothetical protein [Rhodovibrio salinarum]
MQREIRVRLRLLQLRHQLGLAALQVGEAGAQALAPGAGLDRIDDPLQRGLGLRQLFLDCAALGAVALLRRLELVAHRLHEGCHDVGGEQVVL